MTELVKISIDGRKNAIFQAYDVTDKKIKDKIENLFKKIYDFGETSDTPEQFEQQFATHPLNQEYINMFTKVATTCKPKEIEHASVEATVTKDAMDYIDSSKPYEPDIVRHARADVKQKALDTARNTPVIGDVLEVKQHIDLFNSIKRGISARKNRKKEKDEQGKEE